MQFESEATVAFDVAPEVAFDYLADPANRPEWQSSLRSVELLTDGPPRLGTRWVDHTVPGLQPRMETVRHDRPELWAEVGRWHGLEVALTLGFRPQRDGTAVHAITTFQGPVVWLPMAFVLSRISAAPIAADLRRAARILAERQVA